MLVTLLPSAYITVCIRLILNKNHAVILSPMQKYREVGLLREMNVFLAKLD
jgi:hypothetical protein